MRLNYRPNPYVVCSRQVESYHGIVQLVTLCRSHQRHDPAGNPFTSNRQTLHPRDGSRLALGETRLHRRDAADASTMRAAVRAALRQWAPEEMSWLKH